MYAYDFGEMVEKTNYFCIVLSIKVFREKLVEIFSGGNKISIVAESNANSKDIELSEKHGSSITTIRFLFAIFMLKPSLYSKSKSRYSDVCNAVVFLQKTTFRGRISNRDKIGVLVPRGELACWKIAEVLALLNFSVSFASSFGKIVSFFSVTVF